MYHVPVLAEAVSRLAEGYARAVDATVGGGGHTARLLAGGASVLGIDRDPEALAETRRRLPDADLELIEGSFGDPAVLAAVRAFRPGFVLLDLGVSSRQLDAPGRGFSFREGVPLDMRMGAAGPTAADVLRTYDESDLRDIFRRYADEPRAGRLARAVVERRAAGPLETSDDLVGAIRRALGPRSGPADFARIFQALRIAVNDELATLTSALPAFRDALTPGGRLAVIAYHSGEDRIVKRAFRDWARACRCPPAQPVCTCAGRPLGTLCMRRPVMPDPSEAERNPRARSARLRAFEVARGA